MLVLKKCKFKNLLIYERKDVIAIIVGKIKKKHFITKLDVSKRKTLEFEIETDFCQLIFA